MIETGDSYEKICEPVAPVRVGNLVLKSRFVPGNSLPHFLQGPEPYPAEIVISPLTAFEHRSTAGSYIRAGRRFFVLGTLSRAAYTSFRRTGVLWNSVARPMHKAMMTQDTRILPRRLQSQGV